MRPRAEAAAPPAPPARPLSSNTAALSATPITVSRTEIARALEAIDDGLEVQLRAGFVAYSAGEVNVAVPAQLTFASLPDCQGDACVKAGYVRGSGRWVVKVASTFYNNERRLGLSNSQGAMLVFKEATGELEAVLADGGLLTDTRTALAAALCVAEFGPRRDGEPLTVAIYGTGTIGRLVAKLLVARRAVPPGSRLCIVSRNASTADVFWEHVRTDGDGGWRRADAADETREAVERTADVIVTATPAEAHAPVLHGCKHGALVVALGADMPHKREVADALWRGAQADGRALSVVCDSVAQCMASGELGHAVRSGAFEQALAVELGDALHPDRRERRPRAGASAARAATPTPTTTTVLCDLTGVAVQDVVIAGWCLNAVSARRGASAPVDDAEQLVAAQREAADAAASRAEKRALEAGGGVAGPAGQRRAGGGASRGATARAGGGTAVRAQLTRMPCARGSTPAGGDSD